MLKVHFMLYIVTGPIRATEIFDSDKVSLDEENTNVQEEQCIN